MATAVYKIKRLFNNLASLRTTTIDLCIKKRCDLKIEYDGKVMTIPLSKLENPDKFQIHKRVFRSKFNPGQEYELYDFPFIPDGFTSTIGSANDQERIQQLHVKLQDEFDNAMKGFVPQFGNENHIYLLSRLKKIRDSLNKLKNYKASFYRAESLGAEIESNIRNIKFLRDKTI